MSLAQVVDAISAHGIACLLLVYTYVKCWKNLYLIVWPTPFIPDS